MTWSEQEEVVRFPLIRVDTAVTCGALASAIIPYHGNNFVRQAQERPSVARTRMRLTTSSSPRRNTTLSYSLYYLVLLSKRYTLEYIYTTTSLQYRFDHSTRVAAPLNAELPRQPSTSPFHTESPEQLSKIQQRALQQPKWHGRRARASSSCW